MIYNKTGFNTNFPGLSIEISELRPLPKVGLQECEKARWFSFLFPFCCLSLMNRVLAGTTRKRE